MDNEKKKTNRPNNVARIPCSLSDSFFRYWFMFWEPFHKLTKREIDVAATLVKIRFIKSIQDSDYCDECGSTDIGQCSIEEWEKKYIEMYGHPYLEEFNN